MQGTDPFRRGIHDFAIATIPAPPSVWLQQESRERVVRGCIRCTCIRCTCMPCTPQATPAAPSQSLQWPSLHHAAHPAQLILQLILFNPEHTADFRRGKAPAGMAYGGALCTSRPWPHPQDAAVERNSRVRLTAAGPGPSGGHAWMMVDRRRRYGKACAATYCSRKSSVGTTLMMGRSPARSSPRIWGLQLVFSQPLTVPAFVTRSGPQTWVKPTNLQRQCCTRVAELGSPPKVDLQPVEKVMPKG
jgi:hypothetical protein